MRPQNNLFLWKEQEKSVHTGTLQEEDVLQHSQTLRRNVWTASLCSAELTEKYISGVYEYYFSYFNDKTTIIFEYIIADFLYYVGTDPILASRPLRSPKS